MKRAWVAVMLVLAAPAWAEPPASAKVAEPPAAVENTDSAEQEEVRPEEVRPEEVRPEEASTSTSSEPRWKGRVRIVGWVALGVAGALALTSVGFFVAEKHYADLYNDDSRCLVDGRYRFNVCNSDYNDAIHMDSLGISLALAAGAAGVTSAVMLLATRPEAPRRSRRAASLSVGPGPGLGGLSLSGTF